MKQLLQFVALLALSLTLTAQNTPGATTQPVVLEPSLNTATNNQLSLAWYKGNLLFSSDRSKPAGSKKPGATQFFFAQGIYDFEQDNVNRWNLIQPLRGMKTSAPDQALAYDKTTQTYYVMRCPKPAKRQSQSCNIFAYRVDQRGRISRPAQQSFHDANAIIGHPTLSSDGRVMFFTIQKDGKTNLHMARRTGDNAWSAPIMLPSGINTDKVETHPQLFRDSLLFFASDGHEGLGGLDIFYTKIMIDGEGHAVSGSSDLSRLEFSEPVNLGAPINSTANDFSILFQQNGNGGFFVSNRTVNGANRNNIYRFNHEPHVFDQPGQYLVKRLPAAAQTGVRNVNLTRDELLATLEKEAPDVIRIIDTVFMERTVEIPVEKIVEREVFVGGGNELEILQQKDVEIDQLRRNLTDVRNQLATCQTTAANQTFAAPAAASTPAARHTPAQQVASPTGIVYRVQVAAATTPTGFRATFADLHRAMPNLQMETIHGSDGFYRYVTTAVSTFAEADAVRRRIQALGYQCFVSGYRGNERVSMNVR
jgi:hypothetical protein